MKLTTGTYQNHLNNEYQQRTEAFAKQQRLAQSVRGTGVTAFTQHRKLLIGILLIVVITLVSMRTALAHDAPQQDDEALVVWMAFSADAAFADITRVDAPFQSEAASNAWTPLKQRPTWERRSKQTEISHE